MYYHQQNLMQLENFNINIHYKPGRNNANADVLSHFPENIEEPNKTQKNGVFSVVTDGIKKQECCNEAWLCAVNINNLLKRTLRSSLPSAKTNIKNS